MADLIIRNFNHNDVDAFIHLANLAFADEWRADGLTPEDFASQTRKIFRWKMIPYKLLTAAMGVKWEAFVAEKNGQVVGGAMYMGRRYHMVLTNLMVLPDHRRQGIGQALLIRRLERLAERGFPFATVRVLETNIASLGNLRKQGLESYSRYTVYEGFPSTGNGSKVALREIKASDRGLFQSMLKDTMPPFLLQMDGDDLEGEYFLSGFRKIYSRYINNHQWAKACEIDGKVVGFIAANVQDQMQKGFLAQPVISTPCMPYLPDMLSAAGDWFKTMQRNTVKVEVSDHMPEIGAFLDAKGWQKKHTWIGLVKWLDENARHKYSE